MQRCALGAAAVFLLLRSSTGSVAASSSRRLRQGKSDAADSSEEAAPPMQQVYSEADDIARFLEKRRPIELVPEGAKQDVDLTRAEQKELDSIFADGEKPSIFQNCLLVRDFAAPLRVGSALSTGRRVSSIRAARVPSAEVAYSPSASAAYAPAPAVAGAAPAPSPAAPPPPGLDPEGDDDEEEPAVAGEAVVRNQSIVKRIVSPPAAILVAKGGIIDRDEAPDGEVDNTFMTVDMVAYLSSVAGEVSVVPHGIISKWTSKKKVPMAGFLCTNPDGPVFYTLPTPCLATSLDDEGVPEGPPRGNSSEREAFSVFVGSEKLYFSSKKKAASFCLRLAKKIASDPGDNEWDTEKLKSLAAHRKTDMKVSTFVQLSRKDPPAAWTTGTKKLLVVVMDWMEGDNSKAPLSKQTSTPEHYRDIIFPRVAAAFRQMSWGKLEVTVDVVPEVVRFTKPRSRYAAEGWPFPGLYNGAVESLDGHYRYGTLYDARNYDLVYAITPQQAPTGTKGVAWVGAKGAMCNGCEVLSQNFQVMVAVHELGHNLGLSHASSTFLEYGNPFDWMGNYPDVQGLSYGLGYKLKLHWLPRSSVAKINDAKLPTLNDRYIVRPFDTAEPLSGQLVGIQISLHGNTRDIYFSYRKTPGKEAGVFAVFQDKHAPDSELIDMACHTPSQKDARMQPGWTYVDPSSQVVVVLEKMTEETAIIHVYKAPKDQALAAIRARGNFTDGTYKCPRTCTDSDLLVSNFDGCATLARRGYCPDGVIKMGGRKYLISKDLCPAACGECPDVLTGPTVLRGGCGDRNVKINGMSCPVIAAKGHCEASTNIGHVGRDLCPKSCGNCPDRPSFVGSSSNKYEDPDPERTHGVPGDDDKAKGKAKEKEKEEEEEEEEVEKKEEEEEEHTKPGMDRDEDVMPCEDDPTWEDEDGDTCAVYQKIIAKGRLSQREACTYGNGAARIRCRKTCGECPEKDARKCVDNPRWRDEDGDSCSVYRDFIRNGQMSRTMACRYGGGEAAKHCKETCSTCGESKVVEEERVCKDKQCVGEWLRATGQCFQCADWPSRCNDPDFQSDCPSTCGTCEMAGLKQVNGTQEEEPEEEARVSCKDSACIKSWLATTGKCFQCEDFASDYCGNDDAFMESCPKSCKLCSAEAVNCHDDFKVIACKEYKAWGWCSEPDVSQHCRATCGLCASPEGRDGRQSAAAPRGPAPLLALAAALAWAVGAAC